MKVYIQKSFKYNLKRLIATSTQCCTLIGYQDGTGNYIWIETIELNAEVLLNVCKVIGVSVNTEKTNNMEIGFQRGSSANELIRVGRNSYELFVKKRLNNSKSS